MSASLFTDDDGYFTSPEKAAMHAVIVQGGFSTPKREAARMIRDGGRSEQYARAWMEREGLTEDDLEWDSWKPAAKGHVMTSRPDAPEAYESASAAARRELDRRARAKALGTDDPIVHYVRNSSGGPDYPRLCRNAIIAGTGQLGFRDLAVFDPDGIRHYKGVEYDNDPAEPAGGTWHHAAWCPVLGKDAPGRKAVNEPAAPQHHLAPDRITSWGTAEVQVTEDGPVTTGRALILGRPGAGSDAEFVFAARTATAADPVWITDSSEHGEYVRAVIIPAEEYHPPGTCCCKNCPWNGNHEEGNHGTA